MTTKGRKPEAEPPTGPVSPYAATQVGDAPSLDFSDLPSLDAEQVETFPTEGQTVVSPPLHTEVRERAEQQALVGRRLSLVDDAGELALPAGRGAPVVVGDASEEQTETYDLPADVGGGKGAETPSLDAARRLLEEAATLVRAATLQVGARANPGLDGVEPSLKGALERIEHVRWIIGKGGSRG